MGRLLSRGAAGKSAHNQAASQHQDLLQGAFPPLSTDLTAPAQVVHRMLPLRTCSKRARGCKVREYNSTRIRKRLMAVKTQADVCPLCEGTGWKTLPAR